MKPFHVALAVLVATMFCEISWCASTSTPARAGERAEEIRAAGRDVPRLLELARQWNERGDEAGALAAWQRVLELDPASEAAHTGLKHHRYDGRWFATYTELHRHRRAEDERMLKEKNQVRFGDTWVAASELRFLRLGSVRDASGRWTPAVTQARLEREAELVKQGCEQQDLTWIPPAEFEPWRAKRWKCGERWLELAEADRYHAELATPWVAPGEHFVVESTAPREAVEWARWWADRTYDDLVRILGVRPGELPTQLDLFGPARDKPVLVVLRSLEQYNALATGDAAAQRAPVELDGFSSLHYAYFAEAWFDLGTNPPSYRGSGVAFWERDRQDLAPFGQHAVRHAAAQSFVEAVDPSWDALAAASRSGGFGSTAPFWSEKRIPRWLRYGAASYVERWFVDAAAKAGEDPLWARTWALANLQAQGGFGKLADVLDFELSLDAQARSTHLIHQAGAVVAWMLETRESDVVEAHAAFRAALAAGGDTQQAVEGLRKALTLHERAIRKFAAG